MSYAPPLSIPQHYAPKILLGFLANNVRRAVPFQDSFVFTQKRCYGRRQTVIALVPKRDVGEYAYRRKSDVTSLRCEFRKCLVLPQYSSVNTAGQSMVVGKHEIESALRAEKQEINAGRLREDSPLDESQGFKDLCMACRRGDLKACQEKIAEGVNVNARDRFDYTPLNLSSLCGHFEVVRLLLESGALCERDTFEGERCLCR